VLYDGLALVVTGSFLTSFGLAVGCLAGEESMKTKGKQLGKQCAKEFTGSAWIMSSSFRDGLHSASVHGQDLSFERFSTQIVRESAELLVCGGQHSQSIFRR